MKNRLALILSLTAFVLMVIGATPLAQATRDAFPFARNADRVDMIHASKKPKAGYLLPLGKNAKFPQSVLPTTKGPKGDAGPAGPPGPVGPVGQQGPVNPNADTLDGIDSTQFVQNSGSVLVTAPHGSVHPFKSSDPLLIEYFSDLTRLRRSTTGWNFFSFTPDIPPALYGRGLQLIGAEFCYDATNPGVRLEYVELNAPLQTSGPGNVNTQVFDATLRDDRACRLYTDTTPLTLTNEHSVNFFARGNWTTADAPLDIGRVTFILRPTSVSVPDPTGVTGNNQASGPARGTSSR